MCRVCPEIVKLPRQGGEGVVVGLEALLYVGPEGPVGVQQPREVSASLLCLCEAGAGTEAGTGTSGPLTSWVRSR